MALVRVARTVTEEFQEAPPKPVTAAPVGWAYFFTAETEINPTQGGFVAYNNTNPAEVTRIGIGNGTVNGAGDPSVYFLKVGRRTADPDVATLFLRSPTNLAKWAVYTVTAIQPGAGDSWYEFAVEFLDKQTGFAAMDTVLLELTPT